MKKISNEDYVLPRPIQRLADFANARARQTLATKLVEAFRLPPESASAIANAVVNPAAVRKSIGEPSDPEVERISVPGGTLWGIRTSVWSRRVMPDPRNPRTLPSRCHPFAVDPGTGGENAKFRPVPEPRMRTGANPEIAELVVDIESRDHLTWAAHQAKDYVFAHNDWTDSIESQGVMEAVWLVATTYEHGDGSAAVTTMVSAEGSSRITAVHRTLSIRSSDVPYEENESKLRNHIKKLNEAFERGPSPEETIAIRCEQIPALILVGFRAHRSGNTTFPTAVKSLVALRHVDPPRPWGDGPEHEALADEVLDELYRQGLISGTSRSYFAGSLTKAEARAAHLSDDPTMRAAGIVRVFTSKDPRIYDAVRTAVTSQSTRKRMTLPLRSDLAIALIMRSISDEPAKTDQIRRYMRIAFGESVRNEEWQSTDRDVEVLTKEALKEVARSIKTNGQPEPGPASLELAVRAAYALIASGSLKAILGSRGDQELDRRMPSQVLDVMRRTPQGVHQLSQALRDFAAETAIRAVDDSGKLKQPDGSTDQSINDGYLRSEFPPPGKTRARRPGHTPLELLENQVSDFAEAIEVLNTRFEVIRDVVGNDGRALVEAHGVNPSLCSAWRGVLGKIDDELIVWSSTFKRVFGTTTVSDRDVDDIHTDEADNESEFFEVDGLDSATDKEAGAVVSVG